MKNRHGKAHKKCVLVLDTGAGAFVADEYYPNDGGRVHLLGISRYAAFHMVDSVLESKKAAFDVRLVYYGDDWPEEIAGCRDPEIILRHFGLAEGGLAKI